MSNLIRRINEIRRSRHPWYDWGHRVMILLGREDDGRFDNVPRVRDLWFRHENGRLVTTRDYAEVRARNDGEWKVFDSQNDGFEVVIGWWPDEHGPITRTGLDGRDEQRLFLRWFVWEGWIKAEWCGLRRRLYYRALHAAVHQKIPFACQQVPAPDSGGYSHWHCELRRKHDGPHRYRGCTWNDRERVQFTPKAADR